LGHSIFALPNLTGRVPIHVGQSSKVEDAPCHELGESGGLALQPLTASQMPPHAHAFNVSTQPANTLDPAARFVAPSSANAYGTGVPDTTLNPNTIGWAGEDDPHENRQPFLALSFCILVTGIYPSRD
jgi:microcystin-dependent protein